MSGRHTGLDACGSATHEPTDGLAPTSKLVSWDGLLVQYVGRLRRLHPAKKEVRVFDYVDAAVPVLRRMFDRRLKGYRATGYEKGELPDGFELLAKPRNDEGGWDADLETTEDRDDE